MDALSKLTGLHPTVISRSSKFLTDLGLIVGGMRKSATELGKKLGRALEHQQINDAQRYYREAVQSNDKIASLISTLRIKGAMAEKDFSSHVLYVSGQKNQASSRTGSRCVVDLLLAAGLLAEENGRLIAATQPTPEQVDLSKTGSQTDDQKRSDSTAPEGMERLESRRLPPSPIPTFNNPMPQLAINIQLHLPETENAEVYEKLFKALREHLINGPVT